MNDIERFEHLQTTIKLNPKNFQARRELIMLCLDLGFEKVAIEQRVGLLNRDIKPDNILVHNGKLKITDFGLSKYATDSPRTLTLKGYGILEYVAPEAWESDKNTVQMDIYSMQVL